MIGYGNPDRQDDGVAWHILTRLAKRLNRPVPLLFGEDFPPSSEDPQLSFSLQLTPEMAETIAGYERVCFIDAHTGNVPEDVHIETLAPTFQTSPFTHHLTAPSCLYLVKTLFNADPEALLVSVRGRKFGFEHELAPETTRDAEKACDAIMAWLAGAGPE